MEYWQCAPTSRLTPFVECFWTLDGHAGEWGSDAQPVLPDGRPELIVHFGDAFERVSPSNCHERQPLVLFAGQLDSQLMLRATGRISVLGVRFRPYGAAGLLCADQQHLVGQTLAVGALEPKLDRALSRIRSRTDVAAIALPHVEALLAEALASARLDPRVQLAADTIVASRGQVAIERLVDATSITRRHLERRFLRDVGLTPKRLARIARFQHALKVLERAEQFRGAQTAAECGYADQSHFIRDFRGLAGCSPSQHLMERAELTGFFAAGPTRRS